MAYAPYGPRMKRRSCCSLATSAESAALDEAAERASSMAPLRGWVNNAAAGLKGTLQNPDRDDVERVVAVNILGTFWACSVAVRSFLSDRAGGSIVNISSIHAVRGFKEWAAYDMSKGAINALTRHAAVAHGPDGIRVNAVAPGTIRTEGHKEEIADAPNPQALREHLSSVQPMLRVGDPADVAHAVAFLLSDEPVTSQGMFSRLTAAGPPLRNIELLIATTVAPVGRSSLRAGLARQAVLT